MKGQIYNPTLVLAMSQLFLLVNSITTPFNATFDDLHLVLEEAPLQPVGIYRNLSFQEFFFTSPNPNSPGLIPQSQPNLAYAIPPDSSSSSPPYITVNYTDSAVISFGLDSFYYGCVASAAAAGAAPVPCTVRATSFGVGDPVSIALQEFSFEPAPGENKVGMAPGTFEEAFNGGLADVVFEVVDGGAAVAVVDGVVGSFVS